MGSGWRTQEVAELCEMEASPREKEQKWCLISLQVDFSEPKLIILVQANLSEAGIPIHGLMQWYSECVLLSILTLGFDIPYQLTCILTQNITETDTCPGTNHICSDSCLVTWTFFVVDRRLTYILIQTFALAHGPAYAQFALVLTFGLTRVPFIVLASSRFDTYFGICCACGSSIISSFMVCWLSAKTGSRNSS